MRLTKPGISFSKHPSFSARWTLRAKPQWGNQQEEQSTLHSAQWWVWSVGSCCWMKPKQTQSLMFPLSQLCKDRSKVCCPLRAKQNQRKKKSHTFCFVERNLWETSSVSLLNESSVSRLCKVYRPSKMSSASIRCRMMTEGYFHRSSFCLAISEQPCAIPCHLL